MLINLRESPDSSELNKPYKPKEVDFYLQFDAIRNIEGKTLTQIKHLTKQISYGPDILLKHRWNWNTIAGAWGDTLDIWRFPSNLSVQENETKKKMPPNVHRKFEAPISAMALSKDAVHIAVATTRQLYILHLGGIDIIVAADTNTEEDIKSVKFTEMQKVILEQGKRTRVLEIQR